MAETRIRALRIAIPATGPDMSRADGQALARRVAANLAGRSAGLPAGQIGVLTIRLRPGAASDPAALAAAIARAVRGRLGGGG